MQVSMDNQTEQIMVTDEADQTTSSRQIEQPPSPTSKKKVASKSFSIAMQARTDNMAKAYNGKLTVVNQYRALADRKASRE